MLTDLVVQKRKFEVGGQTIELQGLSITDLVDIAKENSEILTYFFSPKREEASQLQLDYGQAVAMVIAFAAGEKGKEAIAAVNRIPAGTQVRMLEAIWELTDLSLDNLGKVASGVLRGLQGANVTISGLTSIVGSDTSPKSPSTSQPKATPSMKS